jgi:sugar lactone lactonase YvrE
VAPRGGRSVRTDIPNGGIHRYDPAADEAEQVYDGARVGGFVVTHDGHLLLFGEDASVRKYDRRARTVPG